jgi:hypothetical protein
MLLLRFHPEMLALILGAVGGLIYAHAANLIPGHPCVSGDPTDDPHACAQALLAGEILVAVAVIYIYIYIYIYNNNNNNNNNNIYIYICIYII